MWCTTCQQDVPGFASQYDGAAALDQQLSCVRCGTPVRRQPGGAQAPGPDAGPTPDPTQTGRPLPPETLDNWEFNEQLLHIERILARPLWCTESADAGEDLWRLDATDPLPLASRTAAAVRTAPQAGTWRWGPAAALAAWTALAAGLAALTCGAVLSGWGYFRGRDDLWPIGLAALLAGQMGLAVGLVLALELVRRRKRQSATEWQHDARPTAPHRPDSHRRRPGQAPVP